MEGSGAKFISPTGYVELDNEDYSIDSKSTRSREYINPKEDLAFYFQTYLVPKYGLDNINVSNVASFLKELEMNWSKLTPPLKNNVLDILVDNILVSNGYDFKNNLLAKLNIPAQQPPNINLPATIPSGGSKSTFGTFNANYVYIIFTVLIICLFVYLLINK